MSKSTITIEDDGKAISLTVTHDQLPTGPRETWSIPAQIADDCVRGIINTAKDNGQQPLMESTMDTRTGHISITRREEG